MHLHVSHSCFLIGDRGCQETALNLSDNFEKLSNTNGEDLELEDMNQNDGFGSQHEIKDDDDVQEAYDDDDLCNDIADERCDCDCHNLFFDPFILIIIIILFTEKDIKKMMKSK